MANRLARAAAIAALVCATGALLPAGALAHDSGLSNGAFRSRDGGATWLQVNTESFSPGALALAVHPSDPHHLLLATDNGLLCSHNGGRDWEAEAADVLTGPAFAVAFDVNGSQALVSGASALYRFEENRWRETRSPAGATPVRVLISGGVAGRAYLAGWTRLYRSDNWGRSWTRVGKEISAEYVSALAVSADRPDDVHALAGGRVWASSDGARSWRADESAPQKIDALAFDRTAPTRLWIVAAGRAYRQDDRAARWQPVGAPIPDSQAMARGISVLNDALLILTDRGLFRSLDAGATWALLGAELPNHIEATLLMRDPHAPATVYAGFSRMGPEQLKWATSPDKPYARSEIMLLVGAYGAFALLLLGVGMIARRMTREDTTTKADRSTGMPAELQ